MSAETGQVQPLDRPHADERLEMPDGGETGEIRNEAKGRAVNHFRNKKIRMTYATNRKRRCQSAQAAAGCGFQKVFVDYGSDSFARCLQPTF
jgi:hypothetical protein